MSKFDLSAFMRDWRAVRPAEIPDGSVIKQPELDLILSAIAGTYEPGSPPPMAPAAPSGDPAWVTAGRSKIGEREIPGPRHNPWIVNDIWKKLGAPWIKTDDADGAWCGGYMAWCLNEAGLPYPGNFPAAKSFATWGTACEAQVGAIAVKSRKNGNHVFQIIGITKDGLYYKGLGGNQSNGCNITDILKSDVKATRWPKGAGAPLNIPLPVMRKGTIGASEA